MRDPCPVDCLESWAKGELPAAAAAQVSAHVAGCPACAHEAAWMRLEHATFAERARRIAPRPALTFARLEARLRLPVRSSPRSSRGFRAAMGASAAIATLSVFLSVLASAPASLDEPMLPALAAERSTVAACVDPTRDAVVLLEAHLGACLMATPGAGLR